MKADAHSRTFAILAAMSNRQARRQQSRQSRRQSGSYRRGQSQGSSQGSGGGSGGGGGGGGRGSNFLSWPFLAGVSILAAVLLAVVIVIALRGGGDDGDEGGATGDLATLNEELANLPTELQTGNKLGSDDAPAKLIQYEDFRCPHCLTYTLNNEGFLIEEFVKPGLLQIEFRHYPVLGDASVRAATGASCAARQDRLFEYANRLFAIHVREGTDSELYENDRLIALAGDLGLDADAFAECMTAPDALSQISGDIGAAQAIGFRGTPNFVLNGLPIQNPPQSNERWREIIQEAIDRVAAEDEDEEDGESGDGDDDGS